MSKHTQKHRNRRRAILAILGQLGWHAKSRDVVAVLSNYGVEVSEGLVSKIKLDGLKMSHNVRRRRTLAQHAQRRPKRQIVRKVPQQREYRR